MKDLLPPEANVEQRCRLPFKRKPALAVTLSVLALLIGTHAPAQEPKRPAGSVQLSFLPPPLEHATYSLGIFDAKTNKLVRHLLEVAQEKDFTVGLNGLITTWDGRDDNGKSVPPGRYAARGYAVGPLKIQGEDIQGNDWAAEDETLRIRHVAAIALLPDSGDLAILAELADGTTALVRFSSEGKLLWRKPISGLSPDEQPWLLASGPAVAVFPIRSLADGKVVKPVGTYQISDGAPSEHSVSIAETRVALPPLPPGAVRVEPPPMADFSPSISPPELSVRSGASPRPSPAERGSNPTAVEPRVGRSSGKDGSVWTAAGLSGLVQTAPDGTVLRRLEVAPGDPLPVAVSAATNADRLYLVEERPGWQRVRGLSWLETKEENGHPVSTWQTFFERSIHPASAPAEEPSKTAAPVEINLDENPLAPGKPQKLRLTAVFDAKGSYLATRDGLRLRQVSERPNLQSAHLAKGKPPTPISFFESDGAATDEFSVSGTHRIMEFDAGEFEMTATGEKPADPKTAEPPDL